MQSPSSQKNYLRKSLTQKRNQLNLEEQQEKSALIVKHITHSSVFSRAKHIAFYHAVRGEADPAQLQQKLSNKKFYLPILSSKKDQGLVFAPTDQNTQYKNNEFGIPEPIVKPSELIDATELDIVIMPLLGFDLKGNRLGMGGGYYDRCFAFKKQQSDKPILMGFAYDFQQVDALSAEPWDVGLDMIATENRLAFL